MQDHQIRFWVTSARPCSPAYLGSGLDDPVYGFAGRRDLAEIRRGRSCVGTGKLRPVHEVQGVKPQLKGPTLLTQLEFPLGVQIDLVRVIGTDAINVSREDARLKAGRLRG